MNKFFSGLAVVALLLTPLAITSPAQAVTLKVHREYGQGPVTIPAGVERVEIVFHGRRGNTVRGRQQPCGKVSLRGPSGRVARWLGGAWRLPAPGRYSFVLTGCQAQRKASAQLTKIRLRPLPVDGDARVLRYRSRGAYEDWATVVVPRRGRVQVRPTSTPMEAPWGALYLEGAPMLDIANWHAGVRTFAAGRSTSRPARRWPTSWARWRRRPAEPLVPRAGQRVILVPAEKPGPRPRHQDAPGARHARRRGRGGGGRAALPGGRRAVPVRGRPVGDGDGGRAAGVALVDPAGAHGAGRIDAGRA